ncbi:MAG: HEAT repeat domain-containing protein [Desulfobulbaceae bacterium]|nr:HEAT repeat domain-containing protein [Desulfobulbaceae bacterium]
MDLIILYNTIPPWDWPEDADKIFKKTLEDRSADLSNRLLAAEMAGDLVVFNDLLARTLLTIVTNSDETEELRARAAISFGAAFEYADLYEFEDLDDIALTEDLFRETQASFKELYYDAGVPKEVRRRILEAVVRAPLDWHSAAVRAAFAGDDENWQLTAVFCMRFIKGFNRQIIEALESDNSDIRYEALLAAGNWQLKKAWPSVACLLSDAGIDKTMLMAAIDAATGIGTPEAINSLAQLLNSDDDDIVDAVNEALAMIEGDGFDDGYDEENDW